MSTRIYYFTGTGNSLWAARTLAEKLGDATLTPMVLAMREGDTHPTEDRVGIVCPVYMYRLPHVVVRFLRQLETKAPVFVVATMGGDGGDVLATVKQHCGQAGLTLSAGFTLAVQSNYVPFGGAPDEETVAGRLEAAAARLDEIAGILQRGEPHLDLDFSRYRAWVHPGLLYKLGYKFISATDRDYRVDDSCDGCAICELVCPVDNLEMVDERPVWQGHCEQCMACMQWCPQEAIQVKEKTQGERRYHHPEVRSKDIVAQKKRGKGGG